MQMENFDNYLEQNPDKQREMLVYQDTARKMALGGITLTRLKHQILTYL